jgi:Helix-turn-helix.
MNINLLINALIKHQQADFLTDRELATKIGIDHSTYSRIKRGIYKPNLAFYTGIVHIYPDLKPLVDAELYGYANTEQPEKPVRKTFLTKCLEAFK